MRVNFSIFAIFTLLVCLSVTSQSQRRPGRLPVSFRSEQQVQNSHAPTTTFAFGMIDYPNSPQTVAQGINKKGEIVGSWGAEINNYAQGLPAYGFSLKGSTFKKIVYPSAPITVPFGVSSSGEIVGYYSLDPEDESGHGFTLIGKTFATVDYAGAQYTELLGINKGGQILAQACFSGEYYCRTYLFQKGTFSSQILYPGSAGSPAWGINDAGEVVGYYSDDGATYHGYTYSGGTFTNLDYPGAVDTYLYGINNSGQIVGAWGDATFDKWGNEITHGFLLDNGTLTSFDLPYAGIDSVLPYAVNDSGVIVGQTIDANDMFLGFEATTGN